MASPPRKATDAANPAALHPDAERARAIVSYLRTAEPSSTELFDAFWQLDLLPVDHVRDALAAWIGPLPDPDHLDPAVRRAHGLPPRALRLRTLSVAKDADVLDLGPIAEAQLRIAGTTWDGADLAPEDRLDGELEGSFAGTLERRVLGDAADATATPIFDVFLYAEDAGVVFAAGTTTVAALIAYGKVETRDRRARAAIQEALAAVDAPVAADAPASVIATEDAEAPSATEPTRVAAKKPAVESVSAKPAPAKKASVERPVKKTAAPKKAAAKKAAPTKAAPTKAAPKKTAAKKAAATKAAPTKAAPTKAALTKAAPTKANAKKAAPKKAAPTKAIAKKAAPKKAAPTKALAKKAAPKAKASSKPKTPSRKPAARATKRGAPTRR